MKDTQVSNSLLQSCGTTPKVLTEEEFACEMAFIQLIDEAEGRLDVR